MPRRSVTARASDSRVLQTRPSVRPASSQTTVGHTSPGNGFASGAATASPSDSLLVYSAIPTCASAPRRSSSPTSVAVVIPPAAVTRAPAAARTTASIAAQSNPPEYGDARLRAPTVHHDFATFGVHSRDDALARQGAAEVRGRGGADHHL